MEKIIEEEEIAENGAEAASMREIGFDKDLVSARVVELER